MAAEGEAGEGAGGEVNTAAVLTGQKSLTESELATLQAWSRRRRSNQGLALRTNIILLAAEGWDSIEVANELSVSNQTVCKWRRRFLADRLLSLGDVARSGAPRSIDDEKIQKVVDPHREDVGHKISTNWRKATICSKKPAPAGASNNSPELSPLIFPVRSGSGVDESPGTSSQQN